jgi:hypothetical protein
MHRLTPLSHHQKLNLLARPPSHTPFHIIIPAGPSPLLTRLNTQNINTRMNSITTPDLEMMAKAYFSDKIAIALGSQFMGYHISFSVFPISTFSLLSLNLFLPHLPLLPVSTHGSQLTQLQCSLGRSIHRNHIWSNAQMDPARK